MSISKILSYNEAATRIKVAKEKDLKVGLVRGVFDIMHIGHVEYLREAKKTSDQLFVGIENDETVKLNKGNDRPINKLEDRSNFLAEMQSVDYVFSFESVLDYNEDFEGWTEQFKNLKPSFIVVSSFDSLIESKKEQTAKAGVGFIVVSPGKRSSTSKILNLIGRFE